MATYPDNLLVKGDVINEVDVVDQNDHNILKGEIIALQTYIGTTPQGNRNSLTDRVNAVMSGSGGFYLTNADPDGAVTYPGLYWYRTDTEALRNVKSDGTIQSVGSSFSNTVFSFSLSHLPSLAQTGVVGIASGSGYFPASINNYYWASSSTAYATCIRSKFYMISGINNVAIKAFIWTNDGAQGIPYCRVSIGGVSGTMVAATGSTNPTEVTNTLNVSSLTVGSYYDIIVELRASSSDITYMDSIIGIGL